MRTTWDQRRVMQSADVNTKDDLEIELLIFAQVFLQRLS